MGPEYRCGSDGAYLHAMGLIVYTEAKSREMVDFLGCSRLAPTVPQDVAAIDSPSSALVAASRSLR